MFLFREQRVNVHIPALHAAVIDHDLDQVKLLLKHDYDLSFVTKSTGSTALHFAASLMGDDAYLIVKELLEKKALDDKYKLLDVNELDANGYTPLHRAAESGNATTIRFLIECGALCDLKAHDGHSAKTLLWQYALTRDPTTKRNTFASASFTYTVKKQNEKKLFSSSSKKMRAAEPSPIHAAVSSRNLERIHTLLSKDSSKANALTGADWTPLHIIATLSGDMNCDIIELLLQHGAEIDALDSNGFTPLHSAASHGNISIMRTLLRHGADQDAMVSGKYTACDLLWLHVLRDKKGISKLISKPQRASSY